MNIFGIAQQYLGEKLTAGKDRDQAFKDTWIFHKIAQKRFVAAFQQTFEINQRTFRVGGRGEGGLEVRLDGVEGFAKEGGEGGGHEVIILFAGRLRADLTCLRKTLVNRDPRPRKRSD